MSESIKTYLISFKVKPAQNNDLIFQTDSGVARVFIRDINETSAISAANAYVIARNWVILEQDEKASVITFEQSRGSDIASTYYDLAQIEGAAAVFVLAEKLPSLS